MEQLHNLSEVYSRSRLFVLTDIIFHFKNFERFMQINLYFYQLK